MGNDHGNRDDAATQHVRRYLDGDDTARDWLVARFSPGLRIAAEHRAAQVPGGGLDPDDLIGEVWVIALPKFDGLVARDGRYTPVIISFLRQILDYTVRNELRRSIRNQRRGANVEARVSQIPDHLTGLVTRAIRNEQITRLIQHVADLPYPERDIVRMRAFEQASNKATAMLLNLGEPTCSTLYKKALQALKAAFPKTVLDDLPGDD